MNRTTFNSRTLLCLLSFTLVVPSVLVDLIPQAEARAGRGSSMGSRGSRTYSAPSYTRSSPMGAQPMQRTMTRPPAAAPSPSNSTPGASPGMAGGAMNRPAQQQAPASGGMSNFTKGLIGGAVGAAGYHMLTGSKESNAQQPANQNQQGQNEQQQAPQQKQSGGFMSLLIRLIIIGLVVWLVIRFIRRRGAAGANNNNTAPNNISANRVNPSMNANPQPVQQTNIQLQQEDYVTFQQRLLEVQDAWNRQDLNSLQKITTPEMIAYFNEQLTDLSSQGLHNSTSNVQFVQGDLSEAWAEGNREYATVAMRYSLIDITTDNTGRVVDGNPNQPVNITELWTFVRATNNKWWLLSAIQQTN
ncbi:Tim44 domain-containing protein [Commensalibacter nepenthis]|uniref:TIM44-like domain-containing protein n=1 Tax=Commensalibacter nepenthis TaxID=3043872 RepID=A0ABT6Q9P4_9PROT|nr:TIM44-like domain-containing protein [Commensalibacter sp. TBRC 10068]MDI2113635.1 TIM44-like domain-containing protein [Commensalibacter sp. TBRC 10068]